MPHASHPELHELALRKLSNVLGPDRARAVMQKVLGEPDLEIQTPQDLMRFAEALAPLGGFEAAVGAMLGVTAVLRGACPTASG